MAGGKRSRKLQKAMKPVRDNFCKAHQEKKLAAQKVDHNARKQQQQLQRQHGGNAEFNSAAAALHARMTGPKKSKRTGHIQLQQASFNFGAPEESFPASDPAQEAELEHSADRMWRFEEDSASAAAAEATAPAPATAAGRQTGSAAGKAHRLAVVSNPFDLLQEEDDAPVRALPLKASVLGFVATGGQGSRQGEVSDDESL